MVLVAQNNTCGKHVQSWILQIMAFSSSDPAKRWFAIVHALLIQ